MTFTRYVSKPRYVVTGRGAYRIRFFYDPICRMRLLRLERRRFFWWTHLHDYQFNHEIQDERPSSPYPQPDAYYAHKLTREYENPNDHHRLFTIAR